MEIQGGILVVQIGDTYVLLYNMIQYDNMCVYIHLAGHFHPETCQENSKKKSSIIPFKRVETLTFGLPSSQPVGFGQKLQRFRKGSSGAVDC